MFEAGTSHHLSSILIRQCVMYLQDGQTPLYIASREGHIAVVQLLLQMFADVSISTKVCHTLCIILIKHSGRKRMAHSLL